MKYIAEIPLEYIEDNIKWLEIVPQMHENIIVGYFMYLYEDISKPAKWDNWYQTLEIAFDAGEDYGVKKEFWKSLSEN